MPLSSPRGSIAARPLAIWSRFRTPGEIIW
jgi:hypothetical protein